MRPYNKLVHPRNWRAFTEYGNGIMGDMCIHIVRHDSLDAEPRLAEARQLHWRNSGAKDSKANIAWKLHRLPRLNTMT